MHKRPGDSLGAAKSKVIKVSEPTEASVNDPSTVSHVVPPSSSPSSKSVEIAKSVMQKHKEVQFIALCNDKARYFVPSKENLFGVASSDEKKQPSVWFKVDHLMMDTGCSTILVPLVDEQSFDLLFKTFSQKDFSWELGGLKGVHSSTCIIKISPKGALFACRFAVDLFDTTFELPFLRFHLVLTDAEKLLKKKLFPESDQDKLQAFIDSEKALKVPSPRKTHALIGQSILAIPEAVVQLSPKSQGGVIYALSTNDIDHKAISGACLSVACKLRYDSVFTDMKDLEDFDHFEDHLVPYRANLPDPLYQIDD